MPHPHASRPSHLVQTDHLSPATSPAILLDATKSRSRTLIPSASQRSDYVEFLAGDGMNGYDNGLSRKKAQVDEDNHGQPLSISVDQRTKSDGAVFALQEQLSNLVDAIDQLEPDTSGAVSSYASQYFDFGQVTEHNEPVLLPHVQTKLFSSIQSVISHGRFAEIPADQLSRIQKLCEPAIGSLEAISLSVGDGWSELDIEEWTQRLSAAEMRLQSARLLLRIMTAGREEKQLYSEDFVQPIINGLKHVVETCVVRATEIRSNDGGKEKFALYYQYRKQVGNIVQIAGRVLKLLGDLLVKVDVSESSVTTVEFLAKELLFVENARSDDNSAIGVQRFEAVRLVAMDVIARVFAKYPDQRTFIFDEVLTSLEKLPTTRHSARQFKLTDGKPIQLVSALLMRLIQTSATPSAEKKQRVLLPSGANGTSLSKQDASDDEALPHMNQTSENLPDHERDTTAVDPLFQLRESLRPLYDGAQSSAQYVVKFLVQRALTATKTGDTPYRNLLDIFTEDFLSVLGSPEWPGAELLLRTLLSNLIGLMDNEKSAVPAKNMALDLMGLIGSGISDLKAHVRSSAKSMDMGDSDVSGTILELLDDTMEENLDETAVLAFDGLYRITIEYLQQDHDEDAQIQSAKGFLTAQWAKSALQRFEGTDDVDDSITPPLQQLLRSLRSMLNDATWLEKYHEYNDVSKPQGRLAAALIVLNLPCCKAFKRIFSILLTNMSSDHATLKARSLKSVDKLLDKDKSILDRGDLVLSHVLRCVSDSSSLTRDNALQLLDKCLIFKPELENRVYSRIIERSLDAATGVRKRAMRILKDIYLRNSGQNIKSAIADALLQRIKDSDESVSDLARQSFEEMWFSPFHKSSLGDDAPLQLRMALQKQIQLIIRTVQRGEGVMTVLDSVLQSVLSDGSKAPAANLSVCKAMVALMFDMLIDNESGPEKPQQLDILETLTVFARGNARLFTAQQLELLQPYIKNLASNDDLKIYRSVIIIFRNVFPALSSIQHTFLRAVQDLLLGSLAKLSKAELYEVAACLWIIDGVLKNTERLTRMTVSVLKGLLTGKDINTSEDQQKVNRVRRYLLIAGSFGKACNFEDQIQQFQAAFPSTKVTSVAGLFIDLICPFTKQKLPAVLRETAYESMGMVCQAFPSQFLRNDVGIAMELPFRNQELKLEQIILGTFKGFFGQQEKRSESGAEIKVGEGEIHGHDRLANTYAATDHEGAASGIAARFLAHVLHIALSKPDELAVTATQVIASITRQGLVHPRETGPALIALESSSNSVIANIAFQEHRNLHQKHETMFEKEYMRSVQQAFLYQKDVLESPGGVTAHPFTAKMHSCYEVLKIGSVKVRRRFLSNICSRSNFELAKFKVKDEGLPEHILFVRFCMENLAFFEYGRMDELQLLVASLEKVVTSTGTSVAHAIETDILKVKLEPNFSEPPTSSFTPYPSSFDTQPLEPMLAPESIIDPERLRQLATASTVLMMVWETRTWLRRFWGMQKQSRSSMGGEKAENQKGKAEKKDTGRPANRVQGVTGDRFIERIASLVSTLASNDFDQHMAICRSFAELLSVDSELRVASDDEEDLSKLANGYETPSGDEGSQSGAPPSGGSKGRKRKNSMGLSGTPKRPKMKKTPSKRGPGRPRKRSGSMSESTDADGDWD